jgi:hypothetical protein
MAFFDVFYGLCRPIFGWIVVKNSSRNAMINSYTLITVSAIGIVNLSNYIFVYIVMFSIFGLN